MKASIVSFDSESEYFFEEGCFINELSNSENDNEVSIAQARLAPGTGTRWHSLEGTAERYVITAGQGRVEVGDLSAQTVSVGDVVFIPPGSPQRITNTEAVDLVFLAICSPRFSSEVYTDLEE